MARCATWRRAELKGVAGKVKKATSMAKSKAIRTTIGWENEDDDDMPSSPPPPPPLNDDARVSVVAAAAVVLVVALVWHHSMYGNA